MSKSEEVLTLLKDLYEEVKFDKNKTECYCVSGASLTGLYDIIKEIESEDIVIMTAIIGKK